VACHLPRLILKAGVVRRLTAAGESFGQRDLAANPFEDAHHCHPGVGPDLVDEAGGKELNDHGKGVMVLQHCRSAESALENCARLT